MGKKALIIIGILVVLGIVYYFLFRQPTSVPASVVSPVINPVPFNPKTSVSTPGAGGGAITQSPTAIS